MIADMLTKGLTRVKFVPNIEKECTLFYDVISMFRLTAGTFLCIYDQQFFVFVVVLSVTGAAGPSREDPSLTSLYPLRSPARVLGCGQASSNLCGRPCGELLCSVTQHVLHALYYTIIMLPAEGLHLLRSRIVFIY